jgi:hypothetical protein
VQRREAEAANRVSRPILDTNVALDLLCQSKVADALEAAETDGECKAERVLPPVPRPSLQRRRLVCRTR